MNHEQSRETILGDIFNGYFTEQQNKTYFRRDSDVIIFKISFKFFCIGK